MTPLASRRLLPVFAAVLAALVMTACLEKTEPRIDSVPSTAAGASIQGHPQDRITPEWLMTRYPYDEKDRATWITSPAELAALLHLRKKVQAEVDLGPGRASDVLLWKEGPPARPYHTKIGGTPYRPEDAPWPTKGGKELSFVIQWYFGDSKDLVGEIPGDVLLLFADLSEEHMPWSPEGWHLEWQHLGIDEPTKKRVVQSEKMLNGELYAELCRVDEYPDSPEEAWTELQQRNIPGSFSYLLKSQASRIGGATMFIQSGSVREGETLLCTLSTVHGPGVSLPLGDVGCLYLIRQKNGRLRGFVESH